MPPSNQNSFRLLWMLGLALTLPMILASGPIAGYLIAFVLRSSLKVPEFVTPLLMGLGLAASGLQSYRLIRKLSRISQQKEEKR